MDSCKKKKKKKEKEKTMFTGKREGKEKDVLRTTTSKGGWAGCEQVGG